MSKTENPFGLSLPLVPGHEIVGRATKVGSKVKNVKIGDHVGVGCMVDSCLNCNPCKDFNEQYCDKGFVWTYGGVKQYTKVGGNKENRTYGGYSASHVVDERFVFLIPKNLPLEKAAPIMCAGITMYDPLVHWGFASGAKRTVGIVGIGGLGTMGIKLAKALGHTVVAISTNANKEKIAKEKGADIFVVTKDPESLKKHEGICDLILNTVSAEHDINIYYNLLAKSGTHVSLGLVLQEHKFNAPMLMMTRKSFSGSAIGGTKTTQDLLELCAKNKIYPDC